MVYKRNGSTECTGYADAGWVGDILKSTSGSLFLLGGAAITWKSNKQTCIALSTAEAEYVALSAAAQEAVWLQQLTSDLLNRSIQEKIIFEDNQSAICVAKNQQTHGRTKHIDIKYHFIRELVETDRIKLAYWPSADMVADILTKGLPAQQLKKLHGMAGIMDLQVVLAESDKES